MLVEGALCRWQQYAAQWPSHPFLLQHTQVKVDRLGLPDRVALFVKALCGPRYNVRTGWLKLTYQSYPEMRQNKRYLLELLQRLIEEAAALAAEFPTGQVELTTASTAKSSKWLRKKDKGKKKKRRSKKHNSPG